MTELSRRFFLGGAISLVAAATFEPLPSMANLPRIYGDGIHDDTHGLGALLRREPVIFPRDKLGVDEHKGIILHNATFKLTRTVEVPDDVHIVRDGMIKIDLLDLDEDFYALRGSERALMPFVGLFTTWKSYIPRTSAFYEGDKIVRPAISARGVPDRRRFIDVKIWSPEDEENYYAVLSVEDRKAMARRIKADTKFDKEAKRRRLVPGSLEHKEAWLRWHPEDKEYLEQFSKEAGNRYIPYPGNHPRMLKELYRRLDG